MTSIFGKLDSITIGGVEYKLHKSNVYYPIADDSGKRQGAARLVRSIRIALNNESEDPSIVERGRGTSRYSSVPFQIVERVTGQRFGEFARYFRNALNGHYGRFHGVENRSFTEWET